MYINNELDERINEYTNFISKDYSDLPDWQREDCVVCVKVKVPKSWIKCSWR